MSRRMSVRNIDSTDPTTRPERDVVGFMTSVVERLDARLTPGQRQQLAIAMPRVHWEFPDVSAEVQLVATPTALRCAAKETAAGLVVRMPLAVLDDAAHGRRSLATSFLAGRISVRGMSPARLREFILLVTPLLDSYREAACEFPAPGATAPDVS
jgi:hypothetical protein